MGRLPDSFAQRKITSRVPYSMEAHIDLTSLQIATLPTLPLSHNVDRPFEIHRMIPRVASTTTPPTSIIADLGMLGLTLAVIQILDVTKQQDLLRVPTPPANLVKGIGELIWEWADPFYLERSESLMVSTEAANLSALTPIRLYITFQGFLVNIAPASDRRG